MSAVAIRTVALIGGPLHQRKELVGSRHGKSRTRDLRRILVGSDFCGTTPEGSPWAYAILGSDQSGTLLAISVAPDIP